MKERNIFDGILQIYDGEGVFIRDGIIIVTSGAEAPDNFTP